MEKQVIDAHNPMTKAPSPAQLMPDRPMKYRPPASERWSSAGLYLNLRMIQSTVRMPNHGAIHTMITATNSPMYRAKVDWKTAHSVRSPAITESNTTAW